MTLDKRMRELIYPTDEAAWASALYTAVESKLKPRGTNLTPPKKKRKKKRK